MRILVVEDEKKVSSFIQRGLEEEGFTVDVAFDGEEGVEKAESQSYDLVLMDVMLPKMDGLAAIKALREKDIQVPVLCLTARDSIDDKVAGFDIGADDYLAKPFAFVELVARCRALIRRGSNDRVLVMRSF